MNWNNYGQVWVIDHIVPLRLFNVQIENDMKTAWNYRNLLPLFKQDNLYKEGGVEFSLKILEKMAECQIVMELKLKISEAIVQTDKYLTIVK